MHATLLSVLQATPMTMPAAAHPSRGERPTGVTILAVLQLLFGAFAVLAGLGAFVGGAVFAGLFSAFPLVGLLGGAAIAMIGMLMLVFGLVVLAVGYGFWTGQPWAWTVGMVLTLLGIITSVLSLPGGIVGLALDVFLIWYYTREGVQRWFGKVGAWPAQQVNNLLGAGAAR